MMMETNKAIGLAFALMALLASPLSRAESLGAPLNLATAENLADFEFEADLSSEEIFDAEQADRAEAAGEFKSLASTLGQLIVNPLIGQNMMPFAGRSTNLTIEIYQAARSIGKQFLIAREYGQIRYVFAVSGGGNGRSTPGGTYGVQRMNWRHMSSLYPSRGENNMDHATFFNGAIAFHSTTLGAYAKLGRADSHGCVRMGRPQARKIFSLIRNHGSKATIYSIKSGEPNQIDQNLIRNQLAKDLNFVQWMLKTKNRGDVPFNEKEYFDYLSGAMSNRDINDKLKSKGMKEIIELPSDQDLGPISAPRAQ